MSKKDGILAIILVVLIFFFVGKESFTAPVKEKPVDLVYQEAGIPDNEYVLQLYPEVLKVFADTRHLFYWDSNYIESVRLSNRFLLVVESLKNLKEKTEHPEVIKNYFDKLRRYRNMSVNKYNSLFVSNPEISDKAYNKKLYGVNRLWRQMIKVEEEIYSFYGFKSFIMPMPNRDRKHNEYYIH